MGIFSKDKPKSESGTSQQSGSRTTRDVAVTGRARELDVPERDREELQRTQTEIRRRQT